MYIRVPRNKGESIRPSTTHRARRHERTAEVLSARPFWVHLNLGSGRTRRSRLGRNKPFLVWGRDGAISGFSPCERISAYEHSQTRLSLPFLPYGQTFENPKYAALDEKKLARAQRRLSRKQKGSKNREKQRRRVAKIHARIAARRKHYQHQLSTKLIRENQTIVVESLAVKNMMQHPTLAKAIADVGWGEFVRQLEYKAAWYGRSVIKIDRFYPSSKTCSRCAHVLDSLDLAVREWDCPNCGAHHDRDINASKSVLAEGLRQSAEEPAEARLWRSGKRKPEWNQGSHAPRKQESGRAIALRNPPTLAVGIC